MSILNDRIGANLGKIRVARGLSQEQLGKLVNLRYQQISLYENGKSNFNTETIEKLADALKVHPDAIIGAEVHTVCIEPTEDELIEKLKKTLDEKNLLIQSLEHKLEEIEMDREIFSKG